MTCCRMCHPGHTLHACVMASVLDISSEKISEAAIMAKGVSSPKALAMPMAMAVLPVPGCPAQQDTPPGNAPLPDHLQDHPGCLHRDSHAISRHSPEASTAS